MAIEFVCPYCDAQIRVPDKAAGKSGKCPRCARKLLVPRVSAVLPAMTVAPQPSPLTPEGPPDFATIASPPRSPAPPAGPDDEIVFAEAQPDPPLAPEPPAVNVAVLPQISPGVARKLKKRRRPLAWIVPVLFGLLLCGGVAWYFRPDLLPARVSGELAASPVSYPDLEPALIDKTLLGGSPEDANAVLTELQSQPIPLLSALMQVQLRGSPQGLQAFVTAGPDTRFYRVDLASNPSMQTWLQKHAADLEATRERQLERAGKSFVPLTKKVQAGQNPISDLVGYRDTLALPALAGGLGYHVVARHKTQLYPCVYQQSDQALYFLLPPDVREFQLEGRAVTGARVHFPAKLPVKVSADEVSVGPRETKPKPAATDEPESKRDMPQEPEPEPEPGDGPPDRNAAGKPAKSPE